MFTLIFYGIIAATVLGAVGVWHHGAVVEGRKEGAAAQFAADKPILAACISHGMAKSDGNADATRCAQYLDQLVTANADLTVANKQFADSAGRQKAAIDIIAKQTADSLARSQAVIAKQRASQGTFDQERARLQAIVTDAQSGKLSCEDQLAKTNALVDGALRQLRK